MPALLRSVVFATESFNPSVVSNGLSTFLLAQAVHNDGIKVVLTGEGADEFFGGYHAFRESGPWREIRHQLISDMQFTELRRLDLSCMAHSVEARCPFLDRAIRAFSDELPYRELYDGGENKVVLRRAFQDLLPEVVLHRPKASLDVGSGVRRTVVQYLRRNGKSEREELMGIWQELYAQDATDAYFHSYPVFDGAISRRGASHR
jgi:asparagine synthase (glutamine-hydrolysing)